ncbi:MAG: aroQ [Ornithinibacter sp.]|nr:aroQ [Ornithinibacter sp.]
MDDRTVFVLNGPNLNLLGEREPEVYGRATMADVEALCVEAAERTGLVVDFRQSNHEGTLVDWVQEGRVGTAGIVINAAGYTSATSRPGRRSVTTATSATSATSTSWATE